MIYHALCLHGLLLEINPRLCVGGAEGWFVCLSACPSFTKLSGQLKTSIKLLEIYYTKIKIKDGLFAIPESYF